MNVESLLRSKGHGVATVAPGETIAEAAAMLAREKIGALVVSEDGQSVLGILSERDIAQGLAVHGGGLGDLAVRELMTRNVVTCAPEDEVTQLMAVMTERRIRHLPVLKGGVLSGIVSIGDVVKQRLGEMEHEADAMREYIAGA
jgi:CBS domain-containing protein